jgi:hypothetical protein
MAASGEGEMWEEKTRQLTIQHHCYMVSSYDLQSSGSSAP